MSNPEETLRRWAKCVRRMQLEFFLAGLASGVAISAGVLVFARWLA